MLLKLSYIAGAKLRVCSPVEQDEKHCSIASCTVQIKGGESCIYIVVVIGCYRIYMQNKET